MTLSDAQKEIRKGGIGSSEIAALVGENPWMDRHTLWRRKTGREESIAPNWAIKRGTFLEPAIIRWYEDESGYTVKDPADIDHNKFEHIKDSHKGTVTHKKWKHIVDSADGIVYDGDTPIRCLEVKTADPMAERKWGVDPDLPVPLHYYLQGIWHCGFWGLSKCDFPVHFGRDLNIYSIDFDEELFFSLVFEAERFWVNHVEADKEPPPGCSQATKAYLERTFAQRSGRVKDVAITNKSCAIALRLRDAKARAKETEKEVDELQNQLRRVIGEDDGLQGVDENGHAWRITWRAPKPRQITDWKAVAVAAGADEESIARFTSPQKTSRRFVANFGLKGKSS